MARLIGSQMLELFTTVHEVTVRYNILDILSVEVAFENEGERAWNKI